jgi:hypothetical protein
LIANGGHDRSQIVPAHPFDRKTGDSGEFSSSCSIRGRMHRGSALCSFLPTRAPNRDKPSDPTAAASPWIAKLLALIFLQREQSPAPGFRPCLIMTNSSLASCWTCHRPPCPSRTGITSRAWRFGEPPELKDWGRVKAHVNDNPCWGPTDAIPVRWRHGFAQKIG